MCMTCGCGNGEVHVEGAGPVHTHADGTTHSHPPARAIRTSIRTSTRTIMRMPTTLAACTRMPTARRMHAHVHPPPTTPARARLGRCTTATARRATRPRHDAGAHGPGRERHPGQERRHRAAQPGLAGAARHLRAQPGVQPRVGQDHAARAHDRAAGGHGAGCGDRRRPADHASTPTASAPPARRRCRSTPARAATSTPAMVETALGRLAPADDSVLMIENVGNLVCPAGFDLGEAHKVVVLSVTEGEDKPLKYPDMFHAASLMLLNKVDLLPYLSFDVERCVANARRINPRIEIVQVSATSGAGMDAWLAWIERGARAGAPVRATLSGRNHAPARRPTLPLGTPRDPGSRGGAGRGFSALRLSPRARSWPGRLGLERCAGRRDRGRGHAECTGPVRTTAEDRRAAARARRSPRIDRSDTRARTATVTSAFASCPAERAR